jgi:hypothetical protein
MALIGYARVSTAEQDTALQTDALRKAGCDKIFEDTVSTPKPVDLLAMAASSHRASRSLRSLGRVGNMKPSGCMSKS